MSHLFPALFLLMAAVPTPYDDAFWKIWGDGQAELSGYDLTYPRYGKPRAGVAVTIFVTEPFSASLRVKADDGKHPASDVFPVMKLNLVHDFQTGIYDYNEMTSSFLSLAAPSPGTLTKITFSSQEWCGSTFIQALFDPGRLRTTLHSYFDGEADQQNTLPAPDDGVSEDQLFFWARGMARPFLTPGQSVSVPLLPSLQASRHSHTPLAWTRARLSRASALQEISVPAGRFRTDVYKCEIEKGPTLSFFVDPALPRRIVKWQSSTGESAGLLASARLKYWQLNQPGGEAFLKQLGLSPRPPRTP
jgi:hypothetical protein